MSVIAVIPSRMQAQRFPGKPLAMIAGKPMILRVYERAKLANKVDRVIIATDSEEIARVVSAAGGEVVMTDSALPSGTDRVGAAVAGLDAEYVLNVQGDEPALDPQAIDDVVAALQIDSKPAVATPMYPMSDRTVLDTPSMVKVVVTSELDALYFSRAAIPFPRNDESAGLPMVNLHLGLYGYRRDALEWFCRQQPSPLELREGLEQLRFLEHGFKIKLVKARAMSFGVDLPDDVPRMERLLQSLGIE